jgi:hypothetical protein
MGIPPLRPMNSLATQHRHALQRVVLFALLVVMPVIIVSGYVASVFGPLHAHDSAQLASDSGALWPSTGAGARPPSHAHVHAHGGAERHWHLPGDSSVIVIGFGDSASATGSNAKPRAKTFLPLAPPVSPRLRLGVEATETWQAGPAERWTSQSPLPLERPPQD